MHNHIIVEGIIGAGKTTTISNIRKTREILVLSEEFDDSKLMAYYNDPDPSMESIVDLRMQFLNSMMENTLTAHIATQIMPHGVIQDRSLIGNLAFIMLITKRRLEKNIEISEKDWILLRDVIDTNIRYIRKYMCQPGYQYDILFLHDSVRQCQERVRKRGREYERNLCSEYQEDLLTIYTSLILEFISYNNYSRLRVVDVETFRKQLSDPSYNYMSYDAIISSNCPLNTSLTPIIFNDNILDNPTNILEIQYLPRIERDTVLDHIRRISL